MTQSMSLSTDELNRLLNYAVALKPIRGMEAELNPQSAIVGASLKLPRTPFGAYLNVSVELLSNAGQIELAAHRALRNYAIKQAWDRNGAISVTREVFICSYETAREALVSVVPSAEASLLEEFSPRR